jgi:hypothetical protein
MLPIFLLVVKQVRSFQLLNNYIENPEKLLKGF